MYRKFFKLLPALTFICFLSACTKKLDIIKPADTPFSFTFGKPTDWLIVNSYGQSNATYSGSVHIALTKSQKYDAIMAMSGISVYNTQDFGEVIPLVEQSDYTDVYGGETVLSASLEKFTEDINDQNQIPYQKKGFQFFGMVSAMGSKSIAALSKSGTPGDLNYYHVTLDAICKITELAKKQGKTLSMPLMYWTQGEDDSGTDQTKEYYLSKLNQLIIDFNIDIKSITNQTNNVYFVGYQLAKRYDGQTDYRIPIAQFEAGLTNPLFVCATPTYQLKYDKTDQIHFIAECKRILGAYYGLAAKKLLVDGKKFLPLYPISITAKGKNLKIYYHVPIPPLKFDTDFFPNSGDYGFIVRDVNGNRLKLSNITILSHENAVSIDCSGNPQGGIFTYARDNNYEYINNPDNLSIYLGDRGNLRDSQGDTIKFDNYPMHNWAVISYLTIN